MADEQFSSLIPQHDDSPEILRAKLGMAVARLSEPKNVNPLNLGIPLTGVGFEQITGTPIFFRKLEVFGGSLDGAVNLANVTLRYDDDNNAQNLTRVITPGSRLTIEAMPGQKIDLRRFYASSAHSGDDLAFEIY